MLRYALLIAGIVLPFSPVGAAELDATRLYEICEHHDPNSAENAVCLWYIRGLIEGMVFGSMSATLTAGYCPPEDGISVDQGRLIIEKYMRDHPEQLHEKTGIVGPKALLLAFPCKRSN